MPGPMGIIHHAARQHDEVRMAISDDLLSLLRVNNQPYGHHRNIDLFLHRAGKSNLVPRFSGDLLTMIHTATRDVDKIASQILQGF